MHLLLYREREGEREGGREGGREGEREGEREREGGRGNILKEIVRLRERE